MRAGPMLNRAAALCLAAALLAACGAPEAAPEAPGASSSSAAAVSGYGADSSASSAAEPASRAEAASQAEAAPSAEAASQAESASQTEAASQAEASGGAASSSSSSASLVVVASAAEGTRDSTPRVLTPSADGTTVLGNGTVEIDASNLAEGYVMVRYLGSNSNVKLQLTKDGGSTYTYNLSTSGSYETFPLAAGSGGYTLNVFEHVSGNQYSQACGEYFTAELRSGLLPFLYPNQYVHFTADSTTVAKGAELAKGASSDLKAVENIYNYVITNIGYDFDTANSVASGGITAYLPDVDSCLASGKGICFDYAAVMTAMLRSQRIPTKLVVGYAGQIYHSWISVYITDVGWVNNIIYFDGKSWVRMDPTFASSGNSSPDIMQYIGNGNNYNALYVY